MKTSRRNLFAHLAAASAALPFAVLGRRSQAATTPPEAPSSPTSSSNSGPTEIHEYNAEGRLVRVKRQEPESGETVVVLENLYDEQGRVVQTTHMMVEAVEYRYDGLGRLVRT